MRKNISHYFSQLDKQKKRGIFYSSRVSLVYSYFMQLFQNILIESKNYALIIISLSETVLLNEIQKIHLSAVASLTWKKEVYLFINLKTSILVILKAVTTNIKLIQLNRVFSNRYFKFLAENNNTNYYVHKYLLVWGVLFNRIYYIHLHKSPLIYYNSNIIAGKLKLK